MKVLVNESLQKLEKETKSCGVLLLNLPGLPLDAKILIIQANIIELQLVELQTEQQ